MEQDVFAKFIIRQKNALLISAEHLLVLPNCYTQMCAFLGKNLLLMVFIPENSYTARSAKAFPAAAPHLSKLSDKQVCPGVSASSQAAHHTDGESSLLEAA